MRTFPGVRRIAVLRGGGLGDLLVALPAVQALAAAYPDAELVLLGMPAHAALLEHRGTPIRRVVELPAAPGIRDQGGDPDVAGFVRRMRGERVDLGVQLHGGGRNSNRLLRELAPRHTVGTVTDDAPPLERSIPYRYYQHETMRWLEVAALAGARPAGVEAALTARPDELAAAGELLPDGAVLAVHPGSTDERRRWPAERFAEVAARAVREGASVVVLGDAGESALADDVVRGARTLLEPADRPRVLSLAGRLSMSQLVGVLAGASALVANDSGPRHLAQALGTPTVGIFWVGNAINAMPQTRTRHRILLGWTTRCPVCGAAATAIGPEARRCAHDPSFVADVTVDEVAAEVRSLMATAPPRA